MVIVQGLNVTPINADYFFGNLVTKSSPFSSHTAIIIEWPDSLDSAELMSRLDFLSSLSIKYLCPLY